MHVTSVDVLDLPSEGSLSFSAIGFPCGKTREIAGEILLGSNLEGRQLQETLELRLQVEDSYRAIEDWQGMSGAALFSGDFLVGTIIRVENAQSFQIVRFLPAQYMFDKDVREVLMKAGVNVRRSSDVHEADLTPDFINHIRTHDFCLKALLLHSQPIREWNVNTEIATIKYLFDQLDLTSQSASFSIELFESSDGLSATRVVPKDDHDREAEPLVLDAFNLIVMIAWHNLGNSSLAENNSNESTLSFRHLVQQLSLKQKVTAFDQEHSGRPTSLASLLVFHREDTVTSSVESKDSEITRASADDRAQVALFVQELAERHVKVTPYTRTNFPATFLANFEAFTERLALTVTSAPSSGKRKGPKSLVNPYRSLQTYGTDQASMFFGRATETAALCDRLSANQSRLTAVVGTSGSGKSSLVRAGLLYRLSLNQIPGSSHWPVIDFCISTNGPHLSDGLASRLLDLATRSAGRLRSSALAKCGLYNAVSIEAVVNLILQDELGQRLVIFVDQFEELFAPEITDTERETFGCFLANALQSSRVNVLITLRADYYDQVLQLSSLAREIATSVYSPSCPDANAYLAIIERPAAVNGFTFEEKWLPAEILLDSGTTEGTLPLLSFALARLADNACKESHGMITWQAFHDLKGVRGVIQMGAEKAIISARDKCAALHIDFHVEKSLRTIFRLLVNVDEAGKAAKRPAGYDDDNESWTKGTRILADELVAERLLTTNARNPERIGRQEDKQIAKGRVIEIAHEAVLTHWTELKVWATDSQAALLLKRRAEEDAGAWLNARVPFADDSLAALDIDRTRLWPDSRLRDIEAALEKLGTSRNEQSSPLKEFLRPERDRLIDELQLDIGHARRAWIGDRLGELGDPRPGVGLLGSGIPHIVWCSVPSGTVANEGWPKLFDVGPFFIAKYAVTLAQFKVFPRRENEWWRDLPPKFNQREAWPQSPETPNHPAQFVSWYEAIAYCRWLSHALGYTVRLPTEWEWQQAATGGNQSYVYPWGTDADWNSDHANTKDGGEGRLVSVGLYPKGASPVKALDMSGNMYEWCQNEFDQVDNVGLVSTKPRTTRGGAWFTLGRAATREAAKITARLKDNPDGHNDNGRIRVCIRLAADRPTGID